MAGGASVTTDASPWRHAGARTDAEALAFFDRCLDAFEQARARAGDVRSHYRLAGAPLTLSFAGRSLVGDLTSALRHLETTATGDGGLTIGIWDGSSSERVPPAPAFTDRASRGNTELLQYSEGRILAAFDSWLGMLSVLDVERNLALFWLRDASHVPITLVGTPFRIILQWWASALDGQLIHAAAVGTESGAVVISGPSGAGKSTTALAALEAGLLYLGDDFVLAQPGSPPRVFSLYNSAKVDDATLETRLPALRDAVHARPRLATEKEVLFTQARWPRQLRADLPLRAILMPSVTGGPESRLVPRGAADALRSLLPGIFPFPGQRQEAVTRLARLARQVPVYRFELGHDSRGVAETLRRFLEP